MVSQFSDGTYNGYGRHLVEKFIDGEFNIVYIKVFKDRLLWFEADIIKSSLPLLGFQYIIYQIKAYNFLYQLIYFKY